MNASSTLITPTLQNNSATNIGNEPPLSAQAALILALIDSLSFLRVDDLEEWLPLTAQLINTISDRTLRHVCVDRFWAALSSGEMDVDRAYCCVSWWSTKGGRELLLFGTDSAPGTGSDAEDSGPYMSGAVGAVAPETKL